MSNVCAGFVNISLCLCMLVNLSSCGDGLLEMEETNDLGYTIRYQINKEDSTRQGWLSVVDTKGMAVEKAHYVNDQLDGLRVLFYENGDTNIVERYVQGLFDGPYAFYYKGGQLKQEGNYQNNKMEGAWMQYYPDGQLKEKVFFEDNKENGAFVEYHANGNIAAEGNYLDGDNEHGELKIYNEKGVLTQKLNCMKGRCSTVWSLENEQENKETE